tara:strand:+ start:1850 stop:2299 length:450 start_codon:yes stop_codon:yes gene_type:complete
MIFETITAIKIANDAISAIREMAGNVKSITEIGPHLSKLTNAQEELQEKADNGDMESFFKLEEIRAQTRQVRELMIWAGRPGLLQDWDRHVRVQKERRENERKRIALAKARRKQQVKEIFISIGVIIGTLCAVGICIYALLWFMKFKGR